MAHLDTPSGRIAFNEIGKGPPLLLLHGSPGNGRSWARVTKLLEDRFRLIMPDLPGHGGSESVSEGAEAGGALTPDYRFRTRRLAEALLPLADWIGGRFALAGHSFGATIALHIAMARPSEASALTLFEPVFFRALALTGQSAMLAKAAEFFNGYAHRVDSGDNNSVSMMIDFWFGTGAFDRLPQQVRDYLAANARLSARDVRSSLNDATQEEDLSRLRMPVLLCHGSNSPPVASGIGAALASLLPNAKTETIEDANHGMLDTHPQEVARLISQASA